MRPERSGETGGNAELQARLRHVYWIGGGSGAGKSTIARRLADRHGLRLYSTDDVMRDHDSRFRSQDAPLLTMFKAMDMDERWVNRSPEAMLESFHWFKGELFSLIVDDLLRLPAEPGVIAEGFRLLPRLVQPLLGQPGHAVWLLPAPEFRRAAFASRGSLSSIAGRTSDPERALRNLLERDRMFTEFLAEETERLELPAVKIDISMTEECLTTRVAEILRL
jgi:2-phosphoglycerate kinase